MPVTRPLASFTKVIVSSDEVEKKSTSDSGINCCFGSSFSCTER